MTRSTCVCSAKSSRERAAGVGKFLHQLEEKMEVALIQLKIKVPAAARGGDGQFPVR